MKFFPQIFLFCSVTSFLFMVIGLFRPWAMLWWEGVQNRRKVIKLYGSVGIVSYLVYWLFIWIMP
ncbi:hypothetical protein SAMN04488109_6593 [Chryseolinea serpens]|uniref:Uncharacterized protein n=1 Tax=Chryseolinea serpens TaxID=947013 RepID=A0A1M5XIF9_9BACT|nr:hypothetical protein [Chryseolinea serpens]SHH99536.1 hypothetical protein SAMN04488109_6593 [Chryseolinea serpens]